MKDTRASDPADNEQQPRGSASEAILGFADRLRSGRQAQPEVQKSFENWVVFRVAGRSLALPVGHVREILRLAELTAVPNAPPTIAGVMNLRGHVLPVVDTHKLLGLEGQLTTKASRVLVFLPDRHAVGLIVDDVTGLERLQAELIQTAADGEPLAALSRGRLPQGDHESILLLEPAKLLAGKNLAFN